MYSPWIVFKNEITAMFEKDPEVKVVFLEPEMIIKLYVDNPVKAAALSEIMPTKKEFGNVIITINIHPSNDESVYKAKYFAMAFDGNEAFSHMTTIASPYMSNPISYCVFKKEVVQYPNDDIGDEHGVCSTLYQDLASKIFENTDGIFFCTDVVDE